MTLDTCEVPVLLIIMVRTITAKSKTLFHSYYEFTEMYGYL